MTEIEMSLYETSYGSFKAGPPPPVSSDVAIERPGNSAFSHLNENSSISATPLSTRRAFNIAFLSQPSISALNKLGRTGLPIAFLKSEILNMRFLSLFYL